MNPVVTIRRALAVAAACLAAGCSGERGAPSGARLAEAPAADGRLFTALPAAYTGVAFENRVDDTPEQNVFNYRNHYNGGGVALGDFTGDGLPELVLTSNEAGARVFLNEGRFRFRDVTRDAGVRDRRGWTTGVSVADVDGDGRLDFYLCHAGRDSGAARANELYLNRGVDGRGVPTFVESAARFGLADEGYGTHAAFLDYDADGDLDLFLLNNSPRPVTSFGARNTRSVRHPLGGDKLYRNDGGRFADVSAAAGIHGSEIGFGLGVAVSDVNRDGRPDIYVANDYYERDYLYVNRGDGTFDESLDRRMPVSSYFSMGLDIADVDNDGWPDVYTTDMLPRDEHRLKTTTSFEGWDVYQAKVRGGYHHQLMRNMLQLNNGDGTFSDVGQMAGVARTDWSWSALIADLDLDGRKDVYVTNGVAKDVTSQDYVAFLANQETMAAATKGGRVDFMRLVAALRSTPVPNFAFRNQGGASFSDEGAAWGLDAPSLSNGAAYGDLDGDGAPDLVVNNINQPAFVYRNNARALRPANRFLQLRLAGTGANRFAVGARVTLRAGGETLVQELAPARGFQSSVDYALTFGLGACDSVDTLTVEWPDGRVTVRAGVPANQRLVLSQAEAAAPAPRAAPTVATPLLAADTAVGVGYAHRENDFVDFDRERLIPKMLSTEGPAVAVGDVNGDRLDDLFLGGAKDQPGELLVQRPDGRFDRGAAATFEADRTAEDVGALFFDADGDGRQDLYVVSGGNEFSEMAPALQDRLYMNDGRGGLTRARDALPAEAASGSRVAAADVDGDGDADLFVGGRSVPWRYGVDAASALLLNDGRGRFTDATARLAPELARLGMVTDAAWSDTDADGRPDLVVVGDWLPITVFRNRGGGRLARASVAGLEQSGGWWNRIVAGDFTGDGRVDFVVGNLGLNGRLRATPAEPTTMAVADFDGNGFVEQVVATYNAGTSYPIALRDDLLRAIPMLKPRFPSYESYSRQTAGDLFAPEQRTGMVTRTAHTFATTLVRANADGSYTLVPLPAAAQRAPVFGIAADDVDRDGRTDLLLGGNFDGVKPELGRMAASYGLLLRGDGRGNFAVVPRAESGFHVPGQTRDIRRLRTRAGDLYVVARNNDRPLFFRPTTRD